MLVMTTIFIGKMESLPPTSDIRMIDVWLILCQLLPFIEVVLLTAKEYFREDENMEKALGEVDEDNSKNVQLSRKERFIIFLNLIGNFGFP